MVFPAASGHALIESSLFGAAHILTLPQEDFPKTPVLLFLINLCMS